MRIQSVVCLCLLALTLAVASTGCGKSDGVSGGSDAAAVAADTSPIGKQLNEAINARKAKEYEKAARLFVAVQRTPGITEKQSAAAAQEMTSLQDEVINAMAAGDPKAKAAIDFLRTSAAIR